MHPLSNNYHRKQNPSKEKKKKNKGPGSLTDTKNKTHQKKKKKQRSGQFNDTENKTHQKKKNKKTKVRAVPGNCPDRQTDRHVALIYKIVVVVLHYDVFQLCETLYLQTLSHKVSHVPP
jgi:hypothetical protein